MGKEIAFFDFDGTITKKDTLLEFLKFQFGLLSVVFFTQKRMRNLIRPAALEEIKILKKRNVKVVIVSASPENWIVLWASQYDIDVIATKLENRNNKLTGKIDGLNCSGFEKVRRVKEAYNLDEFQKIHCYGNSKHDLEMLSIANKAHMKPFRTKRSSKTIST